MEDQWTNIFSLPTQTTPRVFWDILSEWITNPQYRQLHKIEILEKKINSVPSNNSMPLIEEYNQNHNQFIQYHRRLFPKDYKKPNIDDIVIHFINEYRVEFSPLINNPEEIPFYYTKAKKFALQLIPLTEEEKIQMKIIKQSELKDFLEKNPKYKIINEKEKSIIKEITIESSITESIEIETIKPIVDTEKNQSDSKKNQSTTKSSRKRCRSRGNSRKKNKKRKLLLENNLLQNSFLIDKDGAEFSHKLIFEAILFDPKDREKLITVAQYYYKLISKWAKNGRKGVYEKRVIHDQIVSLDTFTNNYRRLKEKYGFWVDCWEEKTDPKKYVYEDIGIAAFLISMLESEQNKYNIPKQSFVDLGCGNGFLVYLLTMEGYPGRGIDLQKRKIWDKYPSSVKLIESPIHPEIDTFSEDWLIGNHADEITPWVPLMASRFNKQIKGNEVLGQRYFILPCCEWDFDKNFTKKLENQSRYITYLKYLETIGTKCRFKVEWENLRIPSTRSIAQIGQFIMDPTESDLAQKIEEEHSLLLKRAKYKAFVPKARNDHRK